jgi:Helix-turn-helix domain
MQVVNSSPDCEPVVSRWLVAAAKINRAGAFKGENLSAVDRVVLYTLAAFCSEGQEYLWASEATLAKQCGLGERTIRRSLAKLENLGPVRRRRRTDRAGNFLSNIIEVALPIAQGGFDHNGEWEDEFFEKL